jgi:hypothetical protein
MTFKLNLNQNTTVADELFRLTGMPTHAYKLQDSSKLVSAGCWAPLYIVQYTLTEAKILVWVVTKEGLLE